MADSVRSRAALLFVPVAMTVRWLLNDIGTVYFSEGDKAEAVRVMRESVVYKAKALGPEHPDVAVSEGNLGIALTGLGENQEALTHIERSVSLLERGLGAQHPDLAIQLSNHGEILNALGRHTEARRSFQRAQAIWERERGPDNRSLAYALTGIGISNLSEGGLHDVNLNVCRRAVNILLLQVTYSCNNKFGLLDCAS